MHMYRDACAALRAGRRTRHLLAPSLRPPRPGERNKNKKSKYIPLNIASTKQAPLKAKQNLLETK